MEALVETHNRAEIEIALESGASVIGINNRNLADMTVDLATTERLRAFIPAPVVVVSESGIKNSGDSRRLRECGVDAVLVGETLVTAIDPAAALRSLLTW
jgi:indole-3-glycerol phosphate synthase